MRKEIICLAAIIALIFVAGCAEEQLIGGETDEHGCLIAAGYSWCESKQECIRTWEEGCPSEQEFECEEDSDCIPLPSDCHPMLCINKAHESNYERPEICTEIFMYEAAYDPEDCGCIEGRCVNKNIGRTSEEEMTEEEICVQEGGEWKTFPNTCVDSCEYRRNDDIMCGMALTDGCDCGEGMCWNGNTCEPI
jgi:hypothetical protein